MVEVALANGGGESLKTRLSRREAGPLGASLKIGGRMPVGVPGEGVHWVLRESPE